LKRVFVAGTDTDVGKTVLAGLLTAAWNAHYWKPVQAGTEPTTDSRTVAEWVGAARVLPERHCLRRPLSPNQAAEREGAVIELTDFSLPAVDGALVVEGAGGLLVPLNSRDMMIDLVARLRLPVVLAARSGLGTLNHTLLSLEALARRGVSTVGVVTIGPEHPDNRRDIARFGGARVVGHIPPLEQMDAETFRRVYAERFHWPEMRDWSRPEG